MTIIRDTSLAVLVKPLNGTLGLALSWSGKAAQNGECSHTFPGGGVEPGESYAEAMCRELEQEVGYQTTPDQIVPINHGENQFLGIEIEGVRKRYHFFFVEAPAETKLHPSEEAPVSSWYLPQQVTAIARQALSRNKRLMTAQVAALTLKQFPDQFRNCYHEYAALMDIRPRQTRIAA